MAAVVATLAILVEPAVPQDGGYPKRPVASTKAKAKQRAEPTLKSTSEPRAQDGAVQAIRDREERAAVDRRLEEATAELANFSVGLFYATIGLFVVTASLWLLAYLQSRDMKAAVLAAQESAAAARTSAEVARHGLVVTQRATVVVKEPKAIWLRDEERELVGCRLFVTWQNVGSTPTRNMVTAIMGAALERRPAPDYALVKESPRLCPATIGPNSTINGEHINVPVELVSDILEHKAHYLLRGWAEYNDVFDHTPRHRTEFCYLVEFEGGPEGHNVQALFHIHGEHNRHYDCDAGRVEDGGRCSHGEEQISAGSASTRGSSAHGRLAQS